MEEVVEWKDIPLQSITCSKLDGSQFTFYFKFLRIQTEGGKLTGYEYHVFDSMTPAKGDPCYRAVLSETLNGDFVQPIYLSNATGDYTDRYANKGITPSIFRQVEVDAGRPLRSSTWRKRCAEFAEEGDSLTIEAIRTWKGFVRTGMARRDVRAARFYMQSAIPTKA